MAGMIVCLALVGKNNGPLFLRTYTDAGQGDMELSDIKLRFHHIVHTSLDIVQELKDRKEMYLDHLCSLDDYEVYGYLTSTNIKIIAVLEQDAGERKAALGSLLQTVHTLYVNYLLNPFSPIAQPITSDRFRLGVDRQVNAYNADA